MKTCLFKMDVLSKQPPSIRMTVTVTDGIYENTTLPCVCVNNNTCIGGMKGYTVSVQ